MMKSKTILALFLAVMTVVGLMPATAVATESDLKTTYGRPVSFGDSAIRTYTTVDKNGEIVALGLEMPAQALTNLPKSVTGLILQFPGAAEATPFQYLSFDWNPQGHEPDKIYTTPHFDFHFYTQSADATNAIAPGPCQGLDCEVYKRAVKEVPSQYTPANYKNVGAVVPRMGNHLIDPSAGEYNNQPFTRTFLYGSYDGKIIFYEPMLSLTYLQSQPDDSLELKLPAAYAQAGSYPTRYSVRYDAAAKVYRISLERFVRRAAR